MKQNRRQFLKVGGIGAAGLAVGATGRAPLDAEATPGQGAPGQAQAPAPQATPRPAPRTNQFKRNFDPVPAGEPCMNFAAFTDTHVGQHNRSPNWDFAQ